MKPLLVKIDCCYYDNSGKIVNFLIKYITNVRMFYEEIVMSVSFKKTIFFFRIFLVDKMQIIQKGHQLYIILRIGIESNV